MARPNSPEIISVNESIDDTESLASSIVESSIVDSLSETSGDHIEACDDSQNYADIAKLPFYDEILNSNDLRKQLEEITPLASYNNISVTNSTNVVMGNVIKVKGVLNINVFKDKINNKARQYENNEPADRSGAAGNSNDTLNVNKNGIGHIIPRNCWLALEPSEEYEYIQEPIDIVIISHTATNSSNSTAENMQILRNIQTFHIDEQDWDDIGYNFLIGDDGNVYEGRGWGVVGVHTYGYNRRSLGISFIGTFMRKLPTEKALNSCKNLLERATEEGHLTQNYKLLAHRQCIATSSPGRVLFEEISKWDHFYNKDFADDLKS